MISNRRTLRILGQSLLALAMGSAVALAQTQPSLPAPPPLSAQRYEYLRQNDPATLNQLLNRPSPQIPQGGQQPQQQPAGGGGANNSGGKQQ
jgi:hypothetical protein